MYHDRRVEVRHFPEEPVEITPKKEIILRSVIDQLKLRDYPLEGAGIYYYSQSYGTDINCGHDPIRRNITIDALEYEYSNKIKVKIYLNPDAPSPRSTHRTWSKKLQLSQEGGARRCDEDKEEESNEQDDEVEEKDEENKEEEDEVEEGEKNKGKEKEEEKEKKKEVEQASKKKKTRTKERRLDRVVGLVRRWRELYEGFEDVEGRHARCSLEDAAKKLRVPKKTLDDYLQQLKVGKKFGFDFEAHATDRVGVLRAFNREQLAASEAGSKRCLRSQRPSKQQASPLDDPVSLPDPAL